MCLKPQPPRPIPSDTKALVGPLLDEDTVYRFVGDVLFDQFHDEDVADLYPRDDQPALSPVLLSSEFRQRLLTHDAESRLFTAVFA